MESFLETCEEIGAEVSDLVAGVIGSIMVHKKWIKTQLEALPYILAALAFVGAFCFITSMLAIMCEV